MGNAAEVGEGVAAAEDRLALAGLRSSPPAMLRERKVHYMSTDDHSTYTRKRVMQRGRVIEVKEREFGGERQHF